MEEENKNEKKVKTITILLSDLEKLSVDEQENYFEDIFKNIYSNAEVEDIRKYALRSIKLSCDPKDNKIHLPYGVLVEKKEDKMFIKIKNNKHVFLIILFLTLLFLSILGSSYAAINYNIVKNLNIDINNDNIPDLNLDTNNDRVADVNIDNNKDKKPDLNIDYKGNRTATFNVDTNNDGIADYNLMNQDTDKDNVCDINCDINNDGWPDTNVDLDGDRKPDLNIDTNKDGKPDLNFDMNNDTLCDTHCDTDGDNLCDYNCLSNDDNKDLGPIGSGSSSATGNSRPYIKSDELIIEFDDKSEVYVTDLYPDDQPGYVNNIPIKRFTVTNKSSLYIKYNLKWVVELNDYETDNFMYKISSNNGGYNEDFKTAPKQDSAIGTEIVVPPYTSQNYEVSFKLNGVGEQNIDQGRTFAGRIELYLDEEISTE